MPLSSQICKGVQDRYAGQVCMSVLERCECRPGMQEEGAVYRVKEVCRTAAHKKVCDILALIPDHSLEASGSLKQQVGSHALIN